MGFRTLAHYLIRSFQIIQADGLSFYLGFSYWFNLVVSYASNKKKIVYLTFVEEKLHVSLPNSGLKAKPHIKSRIKTMMIYFHIVYDIVQGYNMSGFECD